MSLKVGIQSCQVPKREGKEAGERTKMRELKIFKDEKRKQQKERPTIKIKDTHMNRITIHETKDYHAKNGKN